MESMWAIVELMGHVRLAGMLSEEERFGTKMGRIDIPEGPKRECPDCKGTGLVGTDKCIHKECVRVTTQFFGGASVYRITPVSEEVARQVARNTRPAPVSSWDFPRPALPAPGHKTVGQAASHSDDEEDSFDDDDDGF